MTYPIDVLVVADDYFEGIYAQVRVRPRVSVTVYVCFFLHCYLHRKLQLAFSTPDLVYDVGVFFLVFSWVSVVVGCGFFSS